MNFWKSFLIKSHKIMTETNLKEKLKKNIFFFLQLRGFHFK